jgi:hypothetical protein
MSVGEPWQDKNGQWMVPTRVEGGDGDDARVVGMGWAPLTPDHPLYEQWLQYIRAGWAREVDARIS